MVRLPHHGDVRVVEIDVSDACTLNNMIGIMGMAFRSDGFSFPVFQRLVNAHETDSVFSICLSDEGGMLQLGSPDPALYKGKLAWTPIIADKWFSLYIEQIVVNGVALPVNASSINSGSDGCSLDSGTQVNIMHQDVHDALRSEFLSLCEQGRHLVGVCGYSPSNSTGLFDGHCFPMSDDDMASFPDISVKLRGGDVSLLQTPDTYLTKPDTVPVGYRCLGWQPGICLLGDLAMKPYLSVHDIGRNRLGFAPVVRSRCKAGQ